MGHGSSYMGGGWCFCGASQDLCHLQVRVKDGGPKDSEGWEGGV